MNTLARQAPNQPEGTVYEQVFSLLKEWTYCDLILDRALSDPMRDDLAELPSEQQALPINPKKATAPAEECLLLARLTVNQLPLLDRSIEISLDQNVDPAHKIRSIGGWLFSRTVSSERLAKRLEQAIIVRINKAPDALLRLWDPRVIGHLPRILTPQQLAGLLGPIECWAWIDRTGKLQQLIKPASNDASFLPVALPLHLSAEQDAAIDRIELINLLLKALARLGHNIPPERDQQLDELLQTAQRKGYGDPTDIIAYALHALLISQTFDALPEVQEAIAQAKVKGLGLCAALEQFDDAYWEARKVNTTPNF